jgi:hypothetical protein
MAVSFAVVSTNAFAQRLVPAALRSAARARQVLVTPSIVAPALLVFLLLSTKVIMVTADVLVLVPGLRSIAVHREPPAVKSAGSRSATLPQR